MENNEISYNEEPVFYCKSCLSLRIIYSDEINYCDNCGSADIGKTDIETWKKMYRDKYGEDFVKLKK